MRRQSSSSMGPANSSGKVCHCSLPQGRAPCPPGCSTGDGQCWPCWLLSQHFSHHRATCKVQEPAPLLQLSFHPFIFCTAHTAMVARTQQARSGLKIETQRNTEFLGFKETFKTIHFQLPCHFQVWDIHHFSRQPVPMSHHPHHN